MKGRQLIYISIILAVALPLILKFSLPAARMKSADKFFKMVKSAQNQRGKVALLALDFGPNIKAENQPQAEVIIEHLFRLNIPVMLVSLYNQAEGFLIEVPEKIATKLNKEYKGERTFEYGKNWINLGFRPGGQLFIQAMAKSNNLIQFLDQDAYGNPIKSFQNFNKITTIEDISLLAEFTGLVGMFDVYVQFFQREGYLPLFGHGCTSITIPEAYIYLDSGQIKGLLEGIAGAAWYSRLLSKEYPNREMDDAQLMNTSLGIAHLVIILFIILGNILEYRKK